MHCGLGMLPALPGARVRRPCALCWVIKLRLLDRETQSCLGMLQHHVQSQNDSFQTVTKMKPRTLSSVRRPQLSGRHAAHPWLGTCQGQEHSKRRVGWMVLAPAAAGPGAAGAEGTCLGGEQLRVCVLRHPHVLWDCRSGDAAGGWRVCGCWG